MVDWPGVFQTYLNSGIYTVSPGINSGIVKKAALARGLDYAKVDLKKVSDKSGFLREMAHALNFPSYFGMNWDALSDCLTDMSWRPAAGHALLFINTGRFAANAPEDMKTVLVIFDSTIEYWKHKEVPFYIILPQT